LSGQSKSVRVNVTPRTVGGPKEGAKLARRRFQRGQLIQCEHGWAVRFYEDYVDQGKRRRRRVQHLLGSFEKLSKRQALSEMAKKMAAINDLSVHPRTTLPFREQAQVWLQQCRTRKRKPLKPSTLSGWEGILERHIDKVLGDVPLSDVGNRTLKDLVEKLMQKSLSAQTIKNVVQVVKLMKGSAKDEEGNEVYPTKWNHEFIDMPIVDEATRNKPSFTGEQVSNIVATAVGRLQMACVLFAATGLRAGELLGLEVRHFGGNTITVEQAVWSGKVQAPKTANSRRVIDLHPDVANLLREFLGERKAGFIFQTSGGQPITQTNLLKREFHPLLEQLGISKRGFHSFRRYRNTFLRNARCPEGLLKFWMGHANTSMSDNYDRVRDDLQFRREVAASVGVGFELPKTLSPKKGKVVPIAQRRPVVLGVKGVGKKLEIAESAEKMG
jgi:integrase